MSSPPATLVPQQAADAETGSPVTPSPSPPAVPGYEILGELGRGGMGVVYKARQFRPHRLVALKMILAGAHASPSDLARFRGEAEAVARLQHPNIVQIYEVGEQDGRPFFSLEFVEGGSLAQKLASTPQSARPAAQLMATVARAVNLAHQRGIVHRDLTPGNILLQKDEGGRMKDEPNESNDSSFILPPSSFTPKITDFGLAKLLDSQGSQTKTGAILGTPSYMAPEQAEGKNRQIGPAVDVYALGAILYEMLTGRPPFRGATPLDTIVQVLSDEPVSLSRLQPKVPRDLETICLKCLQKEPRKRYASAAALAEDLDRFLADEPIQARPTGTLERMLKWIRRRPALAALAGVSALAIVVFIVGSLFYNAQLQRERDHAIHEQDIAARESAAAQRAKAEADQQRTVAQERLQESLRSLYALQLTQVAAVWEHDPSRGLDLLDDASRCPASLRDFSWGYLYRLCRRDRLRLPGHSSWVLSVAFSPDGRTLATGSEDGAVKLWDTATGKERLSLSGHRYGTSGVAFAPDGQTLATGGGDNTAKLWDVATGKERRVFQGHKDSVWAVAFAPDGKTLATGSIDRTIKLWDPATGQERTTLPYGNWVNAVAFAPDGKRLVAGGWDEAAKVWDLSGDKARQEATLQGHTQWVWSVAFSQDGQTIATASEDKTVKLWDVVSHQERATLLGHTGGVLSLAFAGDGKTLATASGDQTVKLWDMATRRERATLRVSKSADFLIPLLRDYAAAGQDRASLKGHTRPGYAVAFAPDGRTLATGSWDGSATLWDAVRNPVDHVLEGHTDLVRSAVFAPDGKTVATSGWDRTVKLWDPGTGALKKTLTGHQHWIWCLAFSLDGQTLATGSEDRTVKLWDVATGQLLASLVGHTGAVYSVEFSRDRKTLVSSSWEVKIWDLPARQERATWRGHHHLIRSVVISPVDSNLLASASFDGTVKLWNLARREEVATLEGHSHWVWSLAFAPDGRTLASAGGDGTLRLWDVAGRRTLHTLEGHTGAVRSVAYSPDGRTLASAGEDQMIRLWDPVTGQERPILRGHTAEVSSVAFSSDGRTLVSASSDMTARLWKARSPVGLSEVVDVQVPVRQGQR